MCGVSNQDGELPNIDTLIEEVISSYGCDRDEYRIAAELSVMRASQSSGACIAERDESKQPWGDVDALRFENALKEALSVFAGRVGPAGLPIEGAAFQAVRFAEVVADEWRAVLVKRGHQ